MASATITVSPTNDLPVSVNDEFTTAEDLAANVEQQMPLYFHRWEGHEQVGRELAADFTQAEPLHHFGEGCENLSHLG